MEDPDSKLKAETGTRVDLGEDLLEKTKHELSIPINESSDMAEDLANGEILFNEQIFGEAKKIFRRILRKDPANNKAKNFLNQIQAKEIQDLLASNNRITQKLDGDDSDTDRAEAVIEALEKDLRLNFDREDTKSKPQVFADAATEASYSIKTLQIVTGLAPRDIMDIGIAHMEMGLYDIARDIFEELIKNDEYKVSGMYLICMALIYGGQCVEATIRLEPLVRDINMPEEQKADFLYMMGLAFEELNEHIKAKEFYRRVYRISPRYRDVADKIR